MINNTRILPLILCGLIFSLQATAQSSSDAGQTGIHSQFVQADKQHLAIARQLIKAGSLNLALEYLQSHPPRGASIEIWEAWARQKWSILVLQEKWLELKQDARGLPSSFGAARHFAIPYEARAMIELDELDAARHLLQPALLESQLPFPTQIAIREQLIDLYIAQKDYVNAKIEAIRFHDEFKPQEASWFVKRAVIEFLADDAKGAAQLLAPIASIEAKLLQALFRLRAGEIENAAAILQINRQLGRNRISDQEKKLAYALIALISSTSEESMRINRIQALEQYLALDSQDLHPEIARFEAQDLRSAYLDLSDLLINTALMNPGRSSLKYTLAQNAETAGLKTKARALYTDVLLDHSNLALAEAAKNKFVESTIQANQLALLAQLMGPARPLGDFSGVSGTASAGVLNYALEQGNADLISAIAPHLGEAPEGVDSRDWILQKSRVDIFAGRFEEAESKIHEWLALGEVLSGEEVDRVLQPVFDLQAVHQNELSLRLFDRINEQTHSKRHKREILFWKAQSYDGMEQRRIAARHYLRSAMVEADGFDQWGQSARYHAAFTLMEAGAYEDARQLFETLLSVASDASRRATIKQALQRLWLLENQLGG